MAAMPFYAHSKLYLQYIDHMFRKPVTDKDFSQIQIHVRHVLCMLRRDKPSVLMFTN